MISWIEGAKLGPYELVARIGVGGMGEVWKARDARLDRFVALKRLKANHARRLKQEARAIAALNHPHICQLHDIGRDYLVMEYVEGRPLQGPLPVEEAVRLGIQIAEALEEAHRCGIIHRDLKPANIMITALGMAKLLDFGLATAISEFDADATQNTSDCTFVGTVAYMSPEQAEGKPVDARSDIFSFGTVLYEMVSGRPAFDGNSIAQVLSAVLRDKPIPLAAPEDFALIVSRCMEKEPANRFQTVTEVRQVLTQRTTGPPKIQHSIAVLPFANMSSEKDQDYFSDGLAEEIINALSQIPGLKVTARTSAFAFRGKEQDITKIAEILRVRTILEGSVRKSRNRIRVTADLINAADGYHLWSQRYDRKMTDVFAIQDEIATAIASALELKLAVDPAALRRHTPKIPAYEAFLKGRYHQMQLTSESLARWKECLDEAIALDPEFALAHSELGAYYSALDAYGLLPAHEAMPAARAAAWRALTIDSTLAEAHSVLGEVAATYEYDWKESERQFALAMASNADAPDVRNAYHIGTVYAFRYLLGVGRAADAVTEINRALQEDPLNVLGRLRLACCLQAAGREVEAATELAETLDLEEEFFAARVWLSHNYAVRGMPDEALVCAEKAFALAPWNAEAVGGLAGLKMRAGDKARAEELLQGLGSGEAFGAPIGFVLFHLLCSETDAATDWLEKAIAQRHSLVIPYVRSPLAKPIRQSKRWPALARLMRLRAAGR